MQKYNFFADTGKNGTFFSSTPLKLKKFHYFCIVVFVLKSEWVEGG